MNDIPLYADQAGRGPVADHGPFRVQVLGVHARYDRDFTTDPDATPAGTADAGTLTIRLAVLPEPGLRVAARGPIVVDEATDDRGRSLVASTATTTAARGGAFANPNPNGPLRAEATLVAPVPPAATIRLLRGKIPAVALTRSAEPVAIVPLKGPGPIGKAITVRGSTIQVDEWKVDPLGQPIVQLKIRPSRDMAAPAARPGPDPLGEDGPATHLRFRAADGRPIRCVPQQSGVGSDEQGHYQTYNVTVAADPDAPAGPKPLLPAAIGYEDFVRTDVDIPFVFRDLPMP